MKKLLFIGHSYHNKTKSSEFLKEILRTRFDITFFDFDPYADDLEQSLSKIEDTEYDYLLLWQVMPEIEFVNKYIKFKQGVIFPMYDQARSLKNSDWLQYKDFNVINFCKTLHDKLEILGMSTYYIQYFPEPAENLNFGDEKLIFFWHRVKAINVNTVLKLFKSIDIKGIHLHKAIDPGQKFIKPPKSLKNITITDWYDKKEEMYQDIEKAAYYIAPRKFEGIGMSFLEAMAMGRCVVSVDNPTMNEYIKHGHTGLLFNLKQIHPLKPHNLKEIQQNTYEYIKNGFAKWQNEKFKILDWIEAPTKIDTNKFNKAVNLYGYPNTPILKRLKGFLNLLLKG